MNSIVSLKSPPLNFFLNENYTYIYGKTFDQAGLKVGIHGLVGINTELLNNQLKSKSNYHIYEFFTAYLRGYFVIFDEELHLIITSDNAEIIQDEDLFTQSLDAKMNQKIQEFAKQYSVDYFINYDFSIFIAIIESYYAVIGALNHLSGHDLHARKVKNSFLYLSKKFRELREGRYFTPDQHLEFFSWIYHIEISAIQKILGTQDSIVLHDVATNTAFWPSLLATQEKSLLGGLNFSVIACSDIDLKVMTDTQACLQDESLKGLEAIVANQLDITQACEVLRSADVITANDILEHFPEDLSFNVFKNLWQSTRRLLVIHVPFEAVPMTVYGHYTSFNKSKLLSWVAELDDCCDLTESMRSCTKGSIYPDVIDEFLFLVRKNEVASLSIESE